MGFSTQLQIEKKNNNEWIPYELLKKTEWNFLL